MERGKPRGGRSIRQGHLAIWPSKQSKDVELWRGVPEEIRERGIFGPVDDYHGNFNGKVFDTLFERLCKTLDDMKIGPCNIHLDGARYHFHKADDRPNSAMNVADMQKWYEDHGRPLPPTNRKTKRESGPTKDEMLKDLATIQDSSTYTINDIAARYGGHRIFKTPPYHCELQPIEMVWGVVKNMVAANTTATMTALNLKRMLQFYFAKLPSRIFRKVWEKTIKVGDNYLKTPIDFAIGQDQVHSMNGLDDEDDGIDENEVNQEERVDLMDGICNSVTDEDYERAFRTVDTETMDVSILESQAPNEESEERVEDDDLYD